MSSPFKSAEAPLNDVTGLPDGDDFPEVPSSIPRHAGNDRPKIRNPQTTSRFSYYARASAFGKVIEDNYLLHRRELRAVAYGMSRRDDLVLAAAAVAAFENREDDREHKAIRTELQRIATEAMIPAGLDHAANRGTAFHKLSERQDRGDDLAFLPAKAWAALQAWRRIMAGFEIVGAEQFVVNDELKVGGSYDRLLSPLEPLPVIVPVDGVMTQVALIEPGETLIADLKSGRTSDYFGPCYSVQQWGYASGTPYVHVSDAEAAPREVDGELVPGDNGRREWPDGRAPRRDWALIPHIPIDNPEDAGLLWVNLDRGRQLAELAQMIGDARRFDDLFYEAAIPAGLAPAPTAAEATRADVLDLVLLAIGNADGEGEIDALYDAAVAEGGTGWSDAHTEAARARMAELTVPA